jgi:peptidoglycan/xylan/chitin deacetylase (PgdA/CDA1 family)
VPPDPGTPEAFRAWKLAPMRPAPPAPQTKPVQLDTGSPPVLSSIPTDDRVVFLTIDDGAVKDPEFLRMMTDLQIPFAMFLTDAVIKDDYAYFRKLRAAGGTVQNHTLNHETLTSLSPAKLRKEICGQQDVLSKQFEATPRLLRPPYGSYDDETRKVAAGCGIHALVLWRESMQIQNLRYQRPDSKLHNGDIVLAHFRGPKALKGRSMTQMIAALLRQVHEQGFTVARLEDYV